MKNSLFIFNDISLLWNSILGLLSASQFTGKINEVLFCDFLLLLFFGRLLVQRKRKEATQFLRLRGSLC